MLNNCDFLGFTNKEVFEVLKTFFNIKINSMKCLQFTLSVFSFNLLKLMFFALKKKLGLKLVTYFKEIISFVLFFLTKIYIF